MSSRSPPASEDAAAAAPATPPAAAPSTEPRLHDGVRRAAIAGTVLGIPFDHQSVSVFRHMDRFRAINPLIKAPSLVADDGTVLMESQLIIQHMEDVAGKSLRPADPAARLADLRATALALVTCEKAIAIEYERKRPEAIRYALSRWEGLSLFLDDGRVEIDSNTVERSIRPLALTRKNALFAGSDGGAEHWAVIASLVETAKLNSIEPHAYLADIMTRIVNGHPNSRIDELLPWEYPAQAALRDVA